MKIPMVLKSELVIILLIFFLAFSVWGCAGTSKEVQLGEQTRDSGSSQTAPETEPAGGSDPLGGYNRVMDKVNDTVYSWVIFPVAKGYRAVMPEPGRAAVGNFFDNLGFPVRLANNLLQTKFSAAGTECMRFGVNSTVGVMGFGDPATNWLELEPSDEDFGQTLGHYGVAGGPHIVLPLMGHTNVRDALAGFPDSMLDPLSAVDDSGASLALEVVEGVNGASYMAGEYEEIKKNSPDFYQTMRDAYEEERALEVKN